MSLNYFKFENVHGGTIPSGTAKSIYYNKPLFRREGDKVFKTGIEATQLLINEAIRKDGVYCTRVLFY